MFRCSPRHASLTVPALLITIIIGFQSSARADDGTAVSILYHETIRLISGSDAGKQNAALTATDNPATLNFDAYGRRFELIPGETRAVAGTSFTRLTGRLAGLPGSWFSLLRDDEELSGIIDDGVETWLVEPRRRVADLLIEPSADRAPSNVIFRLADMLLPQGMMACATQDDDTATDQPTDNRIDGQTAFAKLGAELQAATNNAVTSDDLRLLVGVIADEKFFERHEPETESDIAAIFNTVEGIYANEIGLDIVLDRVFTVTPGIQDPFSDTLIAGDLLTELGNWRSANQADLGHTHLLTRKNLRNDDGGSLAGISFLGQPGRSGVCNRVTGASLSRDISGLTALIVTHELGHNLGAPHDGDADAACATVPESTFIMSPSISHSTGMSFSDCSIAQIDRVIAAASCLSETAEVLAAPNSGGGGTLGWLSISGLLVCVFLRRRKITERH